MAKRPPSKTVPREQLDRAEYTAELYQTALHLVLAEQPACTIRAKDPHAGRWEFRLYGPARCQPIVLAIFHHSGQTPTTYAYHWERWDIGYRQYPRADNPALAALEPFRLTIHRALDARHPAAPAAGPGLPGTDNPAGGD